MNTETLSKKKVVVAVATVHLFFWFWALSVIEKKAGLQSAMVDAVLIALMVAAWMQYRTVLALRRCSKHEAGGAPK